MKEGQAIRTWCPMYRITLSNDSSIDNRGYDEIRESGNSNCIAAHCMMWRKSSEFLTDGYCGFGGKE